MPQCGGLRSMGVCGFEPTDPPPQKRERNERRAYPRPEGRFLRFTWSAARLIETFDKGFLPRSFACGGVFPGAAHTDGYPVPGQIGFQEAATPIAHVMEFSHNWILFPIITAICLFVLGLLISIILNSTKKPIRRRHHASYHSRSRLDRGPGDAPLASASMRFPAG